MISYLVVGELGEYSNWMMWVVASYETEEAAQLHIDMIKAYNRAGPASLSRRQSLGQIPEALYSMEREEFMRYYLSNPWDPGLGGIPIGVYALDWAIFPQSSDGNLKYIIKRIVHTRHPDEYMEQWVELERWGPW